MASRRRGTDLHDPDLLQGAHYALFLTDRNRILSFIAFCATAPGDRRNFFAA
jgi:hypothetical protein